MEGLTDEANVKLKVDGNSFLTKSLIKDCISVNVDYICDHFKLYSAYISL